MDLIRAGTLDVPPLAAYAMRAMAEGASLLTARARRRRQDDRMAALGLLPPGCRW